MSKAWEEKAKKKTKGLLSEVGGKIFVFPIEENNPFSKFTISVVVGNKVIVFPELMDIEDSATGVFVMQKTLAKNGIYTNYEKDVRFVVYEAQKKAPSLIMKKLRDASVFV